MWLFVVTSSCCCLSVAVKNGVSAENPYLLRKPKSIPEDPGPFKGRLCARVISGLVDLGRGFAESNKCVFDDHVRIGAVNHRGMLQQLREE